MNTADDAIAVVGSQGKLNAHKANDYYNDSHFSPQSETRTRSLRKSGAVGASTRDQDAQSEGTNKMASCGLFKA